MSFLHLHDRPDEPQRDEEIALVDDFGEATGFVRHVRSILSEDTRRGLFEVVDNFNQIWIIRWDGESWIVTLEEE